jgi:hypothetical protein
MAAGEPEVALRTLHGDLTTGFADVKGAIADVKGAIGDVKGAIGDLRSEMRGGFVDLKTTMITGFAGLPTREQSEEMLRILRDGNRRHDERSTHLDVRIREQHLETQQALHALIEGQRLLLEGQRTLATSTDVKELTAEVRRFIDGFLRGRGNGEPA